MSPIVTGFGCRPFTEFDAGATGPAFESRQGRKARVWGTRISGRYGDFGWRHRCSGHSVRCTTLPRMMFAAGARASPHISHKEMHRGAESTKVVVPQQLSEDSGAPR